ncbi:MAG TPA: type II and III secretion system protein family protein [Terriglobia bacterium]|nr:type II and III secretion system protein family protein [Terriglobia bacterium]
MSKSLTVRKATGFLTGVALLTSLATSAGARSQGTPDTGASGGAEALHILVGKSVVIDMEKPVTRVLVSNPAVIDALGTSPTEVVVEAKAAGTSSLILWSQGGTSRMLDVTVDLDVAGLRTAIERAYADQNIQAQADGGRVILSGAVRNKQEEDDLVKMAGVYSSQVVDSLDIAAPPHDRQILLQVKVAEVDRTRLDQLGINLFSTGAGNTVGVTGTQQFGPISGSSSTGTGTTVTGKPFEGFAGTLTLSNLLNIFLFRPDINLGAAIQDLEQKSVLQILAEPNLLALSGQKASFLAGGEFPFPVVQGGQALGVVTIQFRPFGVKLDFTGYVQPDNTVRLHVAPEVSSLDFSNAVTISGFTVPALSTRRAETEIELRDGQPFGIAGLLDQTVQAQLSKIPGIGDIPILGQFFHSKSNQRTRSELVVLVTPRILDPVRNGGAAPAAPHPAMPFLNAPGYDKDMPGRKQLENRAPASGGAR